MNSRNATSAHTGGDADREQGDFGAEDSAQLLDIADSIWNALPVGVFRAHGETYDTLAVNPFLASALGYKSSTECVGVDVREHLLNESVFEEWQERIESQQNTSMVFEVDTCDGRIETVHCITTVTADRHGESVIDGIVYCPALTDVNDDVAEVILDQLEDRLQDSHIDRSVSDAMSPGLDVEADDNTENAKRGERPTALPDGATLEEAHSVDGWVIGHMQGLDDWLKEVLKEDGVEDVSLRQVDAGELEVCVEANPLPTRLINEFTARAPYANDVVDVHLEGDLIHAHIAVDPAFLNPDDFPGTKFERN